MLFLWIGFFDTRFFLKHKRVPLRNFLVLWDKTLSTENIKVSLLSVSFFGTRFFLKHRGVSQRKFLVPWDKKLSTESSELPFLSVKLFESRFFSETEKGCHPKIFGIVRHRLWQKNCDTPPSSLIHKNFRYPKFSETEKDSPTIFFGTVRQKNWQQKLVKQPLFCYPLNFSIPENFLKHRRFLLRNGSVRWDKTVCTENRDTHPLSYT